MSHTPEELEKLKHAPAMAGVQEHILRRWSPRSFADRDVTNEDLKTLFEAARWAASSYNEQPWRFMLGRRGDATYNKILSALVEFNQSWAKTAPVLVLSVGKKTFTHNGSPNGYGLHDTGAAMANLMLQAAFQGLHGHSMAGFNQEAARAAFSIPEDYQMGAVTAIGYLGDPAALPATLRQQEEAPRKRKALAEIVFSDWEKAAQF